MQGGGSSKGVVPNSNVPRKIMVVADPSGESTVAMQYAISHVVNKHDKIILLHVEYPSRITLPTFLKKPAATTGPKNPMTSAITAFTSAIDGSDVDFLGDMTRSCEAAHPKVPVLVEKVKMEAGKEKAPTILSKCEALGVESVDVLIIGQRKSIPGYKSIKGLDTAEYLIENSKCTCVGVQKKGQSAGYLLNTKTHRNFWLLA